jgi:Zn-finger nucleic acid-binding protein
MADRQGVEIDYCRQCRGVWLDRGELDKLIERAATPRGESASSNHYAATPDQYRGRRKSWLSDIFD